MMNLFRTNTVTINRNSEFELRIEKTTKGAVLSILGSILSICIILGLHIYGPFNGDSFSHLFLVVFIGFILLRSVKSIKILIQGSYFTFNKSSNLFKGTNFQHKLSDISHVEYAEFEDSDNASEYSVSIRLNNKKRIKIDRSTNKTEISEISHEISFFLGCKIKKNNEWNWQESLGIK